MTAGSRTVSLSRRKEENAHRKGKEAKKKKMKFFQSRQKLEKRERKKKENVRNSWQSSLLLTEAAGNMFQFQPRNTFNVWTVHDSLRAQLADTNPAFWPELDISHE